jgi:DegV family protein with EDD domain
MHVITDAAGSLTRKDAVALGITLLDSYVVMGDRAVPETSCDPQEIYERMKRGERVSTSQASTFERHQYYESVLSRYEHVLYVCVGSVFTGNYDVAMDWKKNNDPDDRMVIIDTTAASGRLALIALSTAQFIARDKSFSEVIEFAVTAIGKCEEYIFIDKLKYLAAGGRLSRPAAFFGDVLQKKPVISPTAEGAKKVAIVNDNEKQVEFALERVKANIAGGAPPTVMLEYTDNLSRIEDIRDILIKEIPGLQVKLQPISLTTGVHVGPGTWAIAFIATA